MAVASRDPLVLVGQSVSPNWEGGPDDNGYTLRGKPALKVLREFFTGRRPDIVRKHSRTAARR